MGDGTIDGKFTINNGGILRAIGNELQLTREDYKKMDKSIWTEIAKEIQIENEAQKGKIYSGGSDINGAANKNFVVQKNAFIELSEKCWNKIIEIVNRALGKIDVQNETPISTVRPKQDETSVNPAPNETPRSYACPKRDENPPQATRVLQNKDSDPPSQESIPPEFEIPRRFSKCKERFKGKAVQLKNDNKIYYDENGYPTKEVNKDGKLIREVKHNSDGSINSYVEYKYNEKGQVIQEIMINPNDETATHYCEYEYDDNGNMTQKVPRNKDGSYEWYYQYEYDENGNQVKQISRHSDGSILNYNEYAYNEKNELVAEYTHNPDGSISDVEEYKEYYPDEEDNTLPSVQIKKQSYRVGDELLGTFVEEEYDKQGNITRKISRDHSGNIVEFIENEYDNSGNLSRSIERNSNGEVIYYEDYEYNSEGVMSGIITRNAAGGTEGYTVITDNADRYEMSYNPDGTLESQIHYDTKNSTVTMYDSNKNLTYVVDYNATKDGKPTIKDANGNIVEYDSFEFKHLFR